MNSNDDGVTRWRRVADRIRAGIANGSIAERLAPEMDLADAYGVNRHTVRRAIQALAEEGLVRAERGRGTFVNAPAPRISYPVGARTRFSENLAATGRRPVGHLIRASAARADAAVAKLLECETGAALHRLETLHVASGLPLSVSTCFFSAARFPGIVQAYAETGSITEALKLEGLEDYRRRETRITAERVHPADAEHLAVPADSLVLVSTAVDVDPADRPVQAMRTRFPADRMELVFRP
ncbi:phosphonate metabolism transcriptional regulator PhnF [Aureimonas jatrophae]|uniref:GntR family transcriptional regulator, phosphonate transport system regulatory protein n=1 Tax=Aureimonas jatrophae TaxID=1166073 RepID=A0A1H0C7S2_9HYPH|nr:phosphonate metabolism transcriptional regulator PhnF [Aureimonas jatrophae]MBB3949105.1 GntR family phosphonate transport system transcriptional regulator [Aureimonas jatrophae]SDN53876.1 GntR family transcriptional regulator, phosphonate transport system regulatory protein [Aureimonas jatrophae]